MVSKYLLVLSGVTIIFAIPSQAPTKNNFIFPPAGSSPFAREYYGWDSLFANNVTSLIPLLHDKGKSYYFNFNYKATYFQAAQFCEDIHMKLISIESLEENDRIYKYVRDANKGDLFWTSGSKLLDGKHWMWMSEGRPVEFTNWAPGNPDSQTEHCIAAFHSKNVGLTWTDRDCLVVAGFICERRNELKNTSEVENEPKYWSSVYENPYITPNVPLFHFKDKSYFLGRYFKATFQEAIQICKMMEMDLVTIASNEENERIYKYIRDTNAGDGFWTSGSRLIDGTTWVWMSKAELVDYTNWYTGQPDSITDHCIQLYVLKDKGMFWMDSGCAIRISYICEKPRDNIIISRKPFIESRQNFELYRNISISLIQMETGAYYLGTHFKATQSEASRFCQHHHMQLVTITTEEENEEVRKLLFHNTTTTGSFWTSGWRSNVKDKWTWSSGTPLIYSNFNTDEYKTPRGNALCVEILSNATWSEQLCSQKHFFICEKKVEEKTSPKPPPALNVNVNGGSSVKYITLPPLKIENITVNLEPEAPESV